MRIPFDYVPWLLVFVLFFGSSVVGTKNVLGCYLDFSEPWLVFGEVGELFRVDILNVETGESENLGGLDYWSDGEAWYPLVATSGRWIVWVGNTESWPPIEPSPVPLEGLLLHNLESRTTTDLGAILTNPDCEACPFAQIWISDGWLVFLREERLPDGRKDFQIRAYHLETGLSRPLVPLNDQLRSAALWFTAVRFVGPRIFYSMVEIGKDIDGDGFAWGVPSYVHDLEADSHASLGNLGSFYTDGRWIAFSLPEGGRDDLNGDGDTDDWVLHIRDLETGATSNLRYAGGPLSLVNGRLVFQVDEDDQGSSDLNGDGDATDEVLHVLNLSDGELLQPDPHARFVGLTPESLVYVVDGESSYCSTGYVTFRTDGSLSVHAFQDGTTTHLPVKEGQSVRLVRNWLVGFCQDCLWIGSRTDAIRILDADRLGEAPSFLRGDCDGNGSASGNVNDAITSLRYNFVAGAEEPPCLAACDADGNGTAVGQVSDAIYMLTFSFRGGPPPGAPFPECGPGSPTDAEIGCETPACL